RRLFTLLQTQPTDDESREQVRRATVAGCAIWSRSVSFHEFLRMLPLELLQTEARLTDPLAFLPASGIALAAVIQDTGIERVIEEGRVAFAALIELHRIMDIAIGGTGKAGRRLPAAGRSAGDLS